MIKVMSERPFKLNLYEKKEDIDLNNYFQKKAVKIRNYQLRMYIFKIDKLKIYIFNYTNLKKTSFIFT